MRPLDVSARPLTADEASWQEVPVHVWLFIAALYFNMFSGNVGLLGLPVGLDRPLFFMAFVLLLLDQRTERLRWRAVYAVMLATVAWTLWSWMATGSLADTAKAFALTDRIIFPFAMFTLGPLVFSTPQRRSVFLRSMVLLGLYLGLTSVFEFAGLHSLVWPRFISDQSLGIQQGRARGPFLASEPLGMTTALTLFLGGVAAALHAGWWRLLAVVCMVVSAMAVALSLTRSVWVAAILGGLTITVMAPGLRRRLPQIVLGVTGAGAALLVTVPGLRETFSARLNTERSVYDRLLTNDAALKIVDTHPLFGIGWGRFLSQSSEWVRQADNYPLTNTSIEVHNVFLSRAAETGVIGAVLWGLVVVVGPIAALWRPSASPDLRCLRYAAVGAFFVWLLPSVSSPNPYPLPNNLVWLIAGIAAHDYLVVRPARRHSDTAAR